MKEELEKKSVELLGWLEQAIKSGADFASTQTPLYIQELLQYNFTVSLIWFIIFLVLAIICAVLFILGVRNPREDGRVPVGLIGFVVFIIMTFCSCDWIKIKVAPRVYIMDYIEYKIKSH